MSKAGDESYHQPYADPNGPGSPLWNRVTELYQSALGRAPENDDVIRQWIQGSGGDFAKLQQDIYATPEALTYGSRNAQAIPGNNGGGGGASSGNTGAGGFTNPFTSQFNAPANINLGGQKGIEYIPQTPQFNAPQYNAPKPFEYQPFQATTEQDLRADPSYNFRLGQGLGAISNSQAARGLWASGQTGKAFNDYAQNFASTEFGNVNNRRLQDYITNANQAMNAYATNAQYQNNLPYQSAFQNAQATFAPQMAGYLTQAAAGQRANELQHSNSYQKWLDDYNQKLGTARFQLDVNKS